MMKKIALKGLACVMIVLMTVTSVPLGGLAQSGVFSMTASANTEGYFEYEVENGEATITDCDWEISGDVTIPSRLGGYPVTSIGAFGSCDRLTSITIPSCVEQINSGIFEWCISLTKINVSADNANYSSKDGVLFNKDKTQLIQYPIGNGRQSYKILSGVISIENSAFRNAENLINVTIPDSVTTIGSFAFWNCSSLTSIIIPNSVTSVRGFQDCSSLTSVIIPEGVTYIEQWAFLNCTSLKEVTIPKSVTDMYIDEEAFGYCYNENDDIVKVDDFKIKGFTNSIAQRYAKNNGFNFESIGELLSPWLYEDYYNNETVVITKYIGAESEVVIPSELGGKVVEQIGEGAFVDCKDMINVIIPDCVKYIGDSAFEICSNLNSVIIPSSVSGIGCDAFSGCSSLTDVVISDGVCGIYADAFFNCISLKEITIPESVEDIDPNAFGYCSDSCGEVTKVDGFKIKGFTNSAAEIYAEENDFEFEPIGEASPWIYEDYGDKIEIVKYNGNDTEVVIPSEIDGKPVVSIGDEAFYNCSSLTSITIPESVTYIGEYALGYTYDYSKINGFKIKGFTNSAAEIYAEENGFEFESIGEASPWVYEDYNGGIEIVRYKGNEEEVIIPSEINGKPVVSIGNFAFYESGLVSVVISTGVTNIGHEAFRNCRKLTSVTIPNGVTTVGWKAFYDCTSLKEVTIPESVIDIYDGAFGCYLYLAGEDEAYEFGNVDGFKIKSYTNSAAQKYAEKFDVNFEAIDAHKHSYTAKITTKATCEKNGVKTYTCSCGDSYTEVIKATGHKSVTAKGKAATCTKTGLTDGTKCSVCGVVIKAQQTVKATGHKFSAWKTTKKATYTATGTQTRTCSVCKKTETKTIAKLATTSISKCSASLAKTSLTYNGKVQTVAVTVKNGKTTLKNGTHYSTKFSNNTKIGKATVTITGIAKNGYSGTKTLTFNILPGKVPGLKVASQSTSSVKLSWSKLSGTTGYRIYRHDGKQWVRIAETKSNSYTVSKLKAGTSYKFAVRAYTTVGKANYWASSYPTITTATKPVTPTLKSTAGAKSVTLSWNKIAGATGYEVWMAAGKNGSYKKLATIKKNATVKYTAKNLKKGGTYYFKVRAYKTVDGKNIYSAYSAVKNVKVK